MNKKKLFISYSWDCEEHKDWTKKLADSLEEYLELHVTFDRYDLSSQEDKNQFMENGVFNNELVIVVVTPSYVQKANARKGGAGIETKLSSSRHWEESTATGKSNILVVLREGSEVPNYLKEKLYVDFRDDSSFEKSFEKLLKEIDGSTKSQRPEKKHSLKKRPIHRDLTKIEDFLKINHKKRKLIFDRSETTDYSGSNRIKFELWETKSPSIDHYLFIFDNVSIKDTILRLGKLLRRDNIKINRLTVLRSKKGEKGYISRVLKEIDLNFDLEDITFSDYIWDFCIDDEAKVPSKIYKQKFFIDQPLCSLDDELTSKGPAFDFLKKELNNDIQSSAKVIIAPGGTGKTTLCQYVASEYQNPNSAISVFIQSEELRENSQVNGYEKVKIESVYDLYEIYSQVLAEHGEPNLTYDKNTFEVALITGRLVLVIDGMDEIISLFPESFNLDLFLKSIDDLNRQLSCCKVVITSRNDVFDMDLIGKYDHFEKYQLLGFDEMACESYLYRRFRNLPQSEALKETVLANIRPLIESDEKQRILPFVVDLLSSLAEDTTDGEDNVKVKLSFDGKNYESNEEITDYLIYSVLRREWQRQKINIPVEDVLEIFLEIASTHKDSFSKSDFEDIVSIFYSNETDDLFTKILRNPLLVIDGENCRFKYDFISDYFKSLYIIKAIINKSLSEDFIKLIAKNAYGENEVMAGVCKYFIDRNDDLIEFSSKIIDGVRLEITDVDVMSRNDTKFRAIAFIVKLCSEACQCNNSKEKFTDLLKSLFKTKSKIKNLAIYGDNTPLDLEDITVTDSRFIGYKNFPKSKFSNSEVKNCFFELCYNDNPSKGFSKEIFSSCRLGDLETAIEGVEEKTEKERALIEKEVRNFLSSFFHKGAFTDKKLSYIKMSTRIKSINRAFFQRLLKEDIIEVKIEKSDETYYIIAPNYQDSVYGFLSNNKIDRKIEKIIQFIEQ